MTLNKTDNWTYDVAGNRTDAGKTFDDLNRMTAFSASRTVLHDAVGNRTFTKQGTNIEFAYTLDTRNRMESYVEYPVTMGGAQSISGGIAKTMTTCRTVCGVRDLWMQRTRSSKKAMAFGASMTRNSAMNDNTARYWSAPLCEDNFN